MHKLIAAALLLAALQPLVTSAAAETVSVFVAGALPPRPGSVERVDYVSTRNGVASLFLDCEPLAGWRPIDVTEHRRRTDWAGLIRALLEGRYREAHEASAQLETSPTPVPPRAKSL